MITHQSITANLSALRARCEALCQQLNRPAPTLIAVSKTQPVEAIAAALAAGHRHFGENRVQEAAAKWPALRRQYPDVVLHLIGPLQTNKAKDALDLFDVIHTVDRESLVEKIVRLRATGSRLATEFLVEVNLGAEAQKAGVFLPQADAFITAVREQIPISGVMAIPPQDQPPQEAFRALADVARRHHLLQLSMGMSDDWEDAVACGATYLRLGTAVFGPRLGHLY